MSIALLIIDVQKALCSGEYEVFECRRVIDRINHVSAKARKAGAPVILIQHESIGGPLDYGTDGWNLAAGLCVEQTDIYVRKTATDSFHNTDLQALLQKLGVNELIICGLQSDFCVDTTTRRALGLGYPVTLVSDGHSTLDNGIFTAAQISAHHTTTLANITSFGPRVVPKLASEILIDPIQRRSELHGPEMSVIAEGGCACGAIRYQVAGLASNSMICHCQTCRKISGAPVVAWVTFEAASFAFIKSQPAEYSSSAPVRRTFCPTCGTQLTYQHTDHPTSVDVTTCSLDEPDAFAPSHHSWLSHDIAWVRFGDGLPAYQEWCK